jgi:hypothetical protein
VSDQITRLESLVRSALSAAPDVVSDEYAADIQSGFAALRQRDAVLTKRMEGGQVEYKPAAPGNWPGVGAVTPNREAAQARCYREGKPPLPLSARWVGPWKLIEDFEDDERHPEGEV